MEAGRGGAGSVGGSRTGRGPFHLGRSRWGAGKSLGAAGEKGKEMRKAPRGQRCGRRAKETAVLATVTATAGRSEGGGGRRKLTRRHRGASPGVVQRARPQRAPRDPPLVLTKVAACGGPWGAGSRRAGRAGARRQNPELIGEARGRIVERVQEDGKEEELGKGGQEEEAVHARGRPGAGRLIPAEGDIGSERHVGAPSPQRATPPGSKLENAMHSPDHSYSKGRNACLGSEGKEKTNRKRFCSQNSKPQQLTVGLGPEAALLTEGKSQNLV
ncbi:unnamed protein product [Rangifer tarandus platyrhynchus]|uniref:Uncharacterized protein n=2 Tax=Rangifer tarandus platyrhynchus TaxID=3082113 RepID=A0ACB0F6J3_RANTA|nr:unnamed protein product [Rangifer tarandus platyrhynchus]CAI9707721.1 unnamed protein product [Rangifer tarandus platyrhynchus]